jgi:hypothetical protein
MDRYIAVALLDQLHAAQNEFCGGGDYSRSPCSLATIRKAGEVDSARLAGSVAERDGGQEVRDRVVALVFERQRRHGEPGIVGEQGDNGLDVGAFEGVGQPCRDLPLARAGCS